MGNQSSTLGKLQEECFKTISKDNKHFNNAFVKYFDYSTLQELYKELNIGLGKQNSLVNSSTKSFIHTLQFNDDLSFEKVHSRLLTRLEGSYKHIFNIKKFKVDEEKSLCSISRKIYVNQESYDFTLQDLINKKLSQKESFSEQQVLRILRKIVQAIVWINDNEFKNVTLDSQSIMFVSEGDKKEMELQNYVCKIVDQDLVQVNCYKNLLSSVIQRKSQKTPDNLHTQINLSFYLSPQLLQQIQIYNFYPNVSLKSDIFTLGMLMMEICCQQQMYFCYNMQSMTLDYESLIHRIAKISYSNELKLLLAEMLEYDENNRIGFVSLRQKIDKMMVKPFEQSRKLKRRSSSTMLKQLLSCSRASYSIQNSSKPTRRNECSGKISTVSLSVQKKQLEPSPKNNKQSQRRNSLLTQCNSLTKPTSQVNLKCRTNSFLTSRKSGLLRTNSNKKLELDNKNIIQKQIKLQTTTTKVDYTKILKSRVKIQSKNLNCPIGDQTVKSPTAEIFVKVPNLFNITNQSNLKNTISKAQQTFQCLMTDRSIQDDGVDRLYHRNINHSNFQQSNLQTIKQNQRVHTNEKNKQFNTKNLTFVQKKTINLENAIISSSSSKKMLKSKSFFENSNQIKPKQSPLKKERILTQGNHEDMMSIKQQKSESKLQLREGSISLKKISQKKPLKVALQKKPDQQFIQEIKNTNKNWIIGKLKAKNLIQTNSIQENLHKEKNKLSNKKKQTSLSKVKSVSLTVNMNKKLSSFEKQQKSHRQSNPDLKSSQKEPSQDNQDNLIRADTIIKRLQLTDQKQNIHSNIKEQMVFVEKVLQKCALSSSRWQQDNQPIKNVSESSLRHSNLIKYSDFKQKVNHGTEKPQNQLKENQFKKKNNIIDIDLEKINNSKAESQKKTLQSQQKRIAQELKVKNEKGTTSKMKRLKELTIFTEDQERKQEDLIKDQNQQAYCNQNANKQNDMKSSNIQDPIPSITLLGFDQIPYQRIEYINKVSTIVTPNITTPSSLNELNRFYGKGLTVESMTQDSGMHKKNNSTLSKPFQQIQLDYEKKSEPNINSPNLHMNFQAQPEQGKFKKPNIAGSIKKQSSIFTINNSEELTFRLKDQKSSRIEIDHKAKYKFFQQTFQSNLQQNAQKASYFEKQNGSFVMREQNPTKNIQMSSIISQKNNKINSEINHFEQFFTSSNFNQQHFESQYEGYKESFLDENKSQKIMREQDMNSSCNSISLSEIEYKAQKGESLLFPEQQKYHQKKELNSQQRKYKHVSILQPGEEDPLNHTNDLNINMNNGKNQRMESKKTNESNQQQQQNTYRRYLNSDGSKNHMIELNDNLIYEGEINQNGDFQGNGVIYQKDVSKGKKKLIYTGSFVNGFYQGFGTLYVIENVESKRLRIPNYYNRMTFGSQNSKLTKSTQSNTFIPVKYEGQFYNGRENGFGTYFYSNGDKFSGCIKEGTVQGYGTYHIASTNEILSGMWKNNILTN